MLVVELYKNFETDRTPPNFHSFAISRDVPPGYSLLYLGGSTVGSSGVPTTTLNGAIDATQTTITTAAAFLASTTAGGAYNDDGYCVIKIDSEYMLVTGGFATTTLTVIRGWNNTTAAAHANAAAVTGYNGGVNKIVGIGGGLWTPCSLMAERANSGTSEIWLCNCPNGVAKTQTVDVWGFKRGLSSNARILMVDQQLAVDVVVTGNIGFDTNHFTGSKTPLNANDLQVGVHELNVNNSWTAEALTPAWRAATTNNTTDSNFMVFQDREVVTIGSYRSGGTSGNACDSNDVMVAFKSLAGAGPFPAVPARIANRMVGPMALRKLFRRLVWPQVPPALAGLTVQASAADGTFSAPAPALAETATANAANATFDAPVPAPALVAAATAASATFSAPAATLVEQASSLAATATFSAPASTAVEAAAATAATATFSAPAAAIVESPAATAATATFSAPAPALAETAAETAATATFGAPTPTIISGALIVSPPPASCSFSSPAAGLEWTAPTSASRTDFAARTPTLLETATTAAATATFTAPSAAVALAAPTVAARSSFSAPAAVAAWTAATTAARVVFSAPAPVAGQLPVAIGPLTIRAKGNATMTVRAKGGVAAGVRAKGAASLTVGAH